MTDEIKLLRKSIEFHESNTKQVFLTKDYMYLKTMAKEVFISPISNYSFYANLKRRLELAYSINQDLKIVLKDLEKKKLKVCHLKDYISHW